MGTGGDEYQVGMNVSRAGLSDIITATGLGKASLYKAFGNKQAMYIGALGHYEKLMVDAAVVVLGSDKLDPLTRIDAFLSSPIIALRDHNDKRGCFLCNAAADRASLDDETGAMVRRDYEKMRVATRKSLAQAFPDRSAEVVSAQAELVLTIYAGLRVMARAGTSTALMQSTKAEVIRSLSALAGHC